jgi:hypothetical protein
MIVHMGSHPYKKVTCLLPEKMTVYVYRTNGATSFVELNQRPKMAEKTVNTFLFRTSPASLHKNVIQCYDGYFMLCAQRIAVL